MTSRPRIILFVVGVILLIGVAGGVAYWNRGALVCRTAKAADCHQCCIEAGFEVSGSGGGEPCKCFQAVDLVDEHGTIRLRSSD